MEPPVKFVLDIPAVPESVRVTVVLPATPAVTWVTVTTAAAAEAENFAFAFICVAKLVAAVLLFVSAIQVPPPATEPAVKS